MRNSVLPERLYDAYIFDMDGTIYLGDELLPGVKRLIQFLRSRSITVRFLSNNPTKDPQQYVEKLTRLGLPTALSDIANTVVTMTNWLVSNHADKVIFPIAEQPLIDAFSRAGLRMSDRAEEIDIVVASYDRSFDYRKLQIAFDAIWYHRRAILVATNPDRYCPFPSGRGEPDCAAIVAAIEACTQTKCVMNVGKPNPMMLQAALAGLDVRPQDSIMVGDRLMTDIAMGVGAGMDTALPLTGDSTAAEAMALDPHDQPTYLLDRLDQLVPQSVWAELGWSPTD